jgi:hypothetical protein
VTIREYIESSKPRVNRAADFLAGSSVISGYCQIYCEIRGDEGVAGDCRSIYFANFLI